jgi:hypothetical protein
MKRLKIVLVFGVVVLGALIMLGVGWDAFVLSIRVRVPGDVDAFGLRVDPVAQHRVISLRIHQALAKQADLGDLIPQVDR